MCDLRINVGHCDLYFMVQWFCLISWRLWCMNILLRDYESVWPDSWPKNKCRSQWPIFHGPVILPYTCTLKTIWYMNTILWDFELVWPDVWAQNICSTLWPIFHSPVILPNILKTIQWLNIILWDYVSVWPDMWPPNICRPLWPIFHGPLNFALYLIWTSYFGIMSQYDQTCDCHIFVGHCDLYFMVHWISPLSWRLFDVWTSYFWIMSQYDLEITVGYHDLYFMVQWLCLYLNSIWWMNVILLENQSM